MEALPRHILAAATTNQPLPPGPCHLIPQVVQTWKVSANSVVRIVSLELPGEDTLLLSERLVAISPAPLRDASQRPRKAARFGLPLHHPRPFVTPPPVGSEAQKRELLPPGRARPSLFALLRLAEPNQPGLLRMNGEAVLPESLRQHLHHPLGVALLHEHQYRIICDPDQERFPLQPRLPLRLKPPVQHLVQVDVRKHR